MKRKILNLSAIRQCAVPSSSQCMSRLARLPHLLAYGGPEAALNRVRRQSVQDALQQPSMAQPWVRAIAREAAALVGRHLSPHEIQRLVTHEVGTLIAGYAQLVLEFDPDNQSLAIVREGCKVSHVDLNPSTKTVW